MIGGALMIRTPTTRMKTKGTAYNKDKDVYNKDNEQEDAKDDR